MGISERSGKDASRQGGVSRQLLFPFLSNLSTVQHSRPCGDNLSLQSAPASRVFRHTHKYSQVCPWPSIGTHASYGAARPVARGSLWANVLIPRAQPECQWPKSHYWVSALLITMSFSSLLVFRKIPFLFSEETTLSHIWEFARLWFLL
jgi:hypothetical protein